MGRKEKVIMKRKRVPDSPPNPRDKSVGRKNI